MKFKNIPKKASFIAALALTVMACNENKIVEKGYTPVVPQLQSSIMTPEVLWSFGRLGSVTVSPDEREIVYSVTYFNKEENKGYTDLYLLDVESGESTRITDSKVNESSPSWSADGKKVRFLSEGALWEMNKDGSDRQKISNSETPIQGYLFSGDDKRVALLSSVKLEPTVATMHPDLPKADARIIDDQFYRHWDHWVDGYTHIFVSDVEEGQPITLGTDILEGEHWEAPLRPFGGVEQLAWADDGESIIYTCRKKEGLDYAESTNSDLYRYNVSSKQTVNLTEGMMGYDKNPVISPNGKYMAWESMERDGYEADKSRLYVMNFATGEKMDYTLGFDQEASSLTWADDSTIYFTSTKEGRHPIYRVDLETSNIDQITNGDYDFNSPAITENGIVASRMSISSPSELILINPSTKETKQLTHINKPILDQLDMGKVEERWIETTDGKKMLTWVIYPPNFDPNKKYPAILYCQGGPQSPVSQFWSYRWNFQMMAANGYIVVAPNRRGLPGFGQEWLEQISGDYSGQNIKDYLSAIDEVKKEPFVDEDRIGCVGASYGGYSVYYLAGHHDNRFKAFIAHCGIFDTESQYYETEEMWFANWDMGGAPWEKDNKIAQRTFANSPHKFVGNWDTPILVIHGQKDYRIDASQGMSAFNAARMRGVPARYLYFPEENHWVSGCQNGILWQRTFFDWLDRWVKNGENKPTNK